MYGFSYHVLEHEKNNKYIDIDFHLLKKDDFISWIKIKKQVSTF